MADMTTLHVHLLPALVEPEVLAGKTVVVTDVLRATTTLIQALAAGVARIVVCGEVEEARRLTETPAFANALLGGERQGVRLPGFDLGNSPSEYQPQRVAGRALIFTTTNGTLAMLRCRLARQVVLGGLVNRRAVVDRLAGLDELHILCAGTGGAVTLEDVTFAGGVIGGLREAGSAVRLMNDEARLAEALWDQAGVDALAPTDRVKRLEQLLVESLGGRNLIAEGFRADLTIAAELDRWDLVPRFDPESREVSRWLAE